MLTSGINFINFKKKIKSSKIKKRLRELILNKNNKVIESLSNNYKFSFNKNGLKKYKNNSHFRIIGMGGSSLGTQTIYDFLGYKIKKKFIFIDNLQSNQKKNEKKKVCKFNYF